MDNNKTILASASYEKQKYYINNDFYDLPQQIKNEIKTICVIMAERLRCIFIMGFHDDGEIYFETVDDNDPNFDNIGAELDIRELYREKEELLSSLKLWYLVFKQNRTDLI